VLVFVVRALKWECIEFQSVDFEGTSMVGRATRSAASRAIFAISGVLLGLGFGLSPAAAQNTLQVTDQFGNTCQASQLIGAPNGGSQCPAGSAPGVVTPVVINRGPISSTRYFDKLTRQRSAPGTAFSGGYDFGADEFGFDLLPGAPPRPGGLGMYVTPDVGGATAVTLGGGGYTTRSSGVGVTDSAGLLAPGAVANGFRENGGSGGISGSYDATRLVGPNQKLLFTGAFDYTSAKADYFGGAGSINADTYNFMGSLLYSNANTYVVVKGGVGFGDLSEFTTIDASSGSYRSESYTIDGRLGHLFMLINAPAAVPGPRYAKAPVAPVTPGYSLGLDLSGHLGYSKDIAKAFTDTAGFSFGEERVQGGEVGVRAKLVAAVPSGGVTWFPYISGTADWRFDYSHVADFPIQVALPTGDSVRFGDGTTQLGAQLGVDARAANGWTVGVNGFYTHTTTAEVTGGRAFLRIPIGPSAVVARY
jgi:hypothetical protein